MGGGLLGHLSQQDREDVEEDVACVCVRCGKEGGSKNDKCYCQKCMDVLEFLLPSNWNLKHEIGILTSRLNYRVESRPDPVYEAEIPKMRERIHLCEMELIRREKLIPITKKNAIQVCKEMWDCLAFEHGDDEYDVDIDTLKDLWLDSRGYDENMVDCGCPLCEAFKVNTTDEVDCKACPLYLKRHLAGSCYKRGFASSMDGEEIMAFNRIVQKIKVKKGA